jgi:hypothetical protein
VHGRAGKGRQHIVGFLPVDLWGGGGGHRTSEKLVTSGGLKFLNSLSICAYYERKMFKFCNFIEGRPPVKCCAPGQIFLWVSWPFDLPFSAHMLTLFLGKTAKHMRQINTRTWTHTDNSTYTYEPTPTRANNSAAATCAHLCRTMGRHERVGQYVPVT